MTENVKNDENLLKEYIVLIQKINSNNNLILQSRQMIEENRSMILNNYASAFSGNNKFARANTEEIYRNRNSIF